MHTSCVTQHRNVNKDESRAVNMLYTQGQLISKCPFSVFKSTKKPTKFLYGFLALYLNTFFKVTLFFF
jgi:hypothetical protein